MTKAENTRQMIIERSAPLFNEKGFAGTSMADIIKASKVAKGCIYGHFNSKDDLAYACVDYLFSRMNERRDDLLGRLHTARAKLFAFMDLNKNPLHSEITGGCPIVNFATEADDTNPVIKKKVRDMLQTAITELTETLEEGIKNKEFSSGLDANEFVVKMFFAIEGANVICRVLNSNKHMGTVLKSLKGELDSYLLIPASTN